MIDNAALSENISGFTSALNNSWMIEWSPLVDQNDFYLLAAIAGIMLFISFFIFKKSRFTRITAILVFLAALANPSIVEQQRQSVPDVALVINDMSPSQQSAERSKMTARALAHVKSQLSKGDKNIEIRYIEQPDQNNSLASKTELIKVIEEGYRDVPRSRRAGVIMITDGQVHDVPEQISSEEYGPVHALITGNRKEKDRQIILKSSPAYGIVGKEVTVEYMVEDTENVGEEFAAISITENNALTQNVLVRVGQPQLHTFKLEHTGKNVLHIKTQDVKDEITQANNELPIVINGVRDRLKVLLVSGRPHTGGRTWRDLLSSDPGVDLVHFTILREPSKQDRTPQHELSLIAFPFRELFEVKLYDFDLIIFDRYNLKRILPSFYFSNIARYVQEGGAFLEVSGPEFATENSIYSTPLRNILPASPDGNVINGMYDPYVTEIGARHPVTQNLHQALANGTDDLQIWSPWFRQVSTQSARGNIVMEGIHQKPLLILDRIGKGRVAQFTSDQIWLWSRGFDEGGPQTELLRRLAHWLMKEPELEENALNAYIDGNEILIQRRSLDDNPVDVELRVSDQVPKTITLEYDSDRNLLEARSPITNLGIHAVTDGQQSAFAIAGELNPPEFREVTATQDKLEPLIDQSNGGIIWLSENAEPNIRYTASNNNFSGRNWISFKKNNSFVITGSQHKPILPSWFYALILMAVIIGGWWYEGKKS